MKEKILFITIIFTIIVLVFSCKKEEATNSSVNTPTIIGNWTYDNSVNWVTITGSPIKKDTSVAHTGEYADFRTDGKVYSRNWHNSVYSYDTSNFVVKGTNLIVSYLNAGYSKSDTFEIKTLTVNKLTLYGFYITSGALEEWWENFSK